MVFWYGHWQWSRRFGLEDMTSIILSSTLVLAILIFVYPLKFLFSLAMNWYSGGRLSPDAEIRSLDELYAIFAIYGIAYAVMAALIAAINFHGLRQRESLDLNPLEIAIARAEAGAWSVVCAVGALSAAIALFTPKSEIVLPGWVYMLLPIIMPLFGARNRRTIHQLRAAQPLSSNPAAERTEAAR